MAKTIKATADRSIRSRSMIVITIFTAIALFSIIMAVYDISNRMVLFGVLFALAAAIFIALTLLKVNAAFGTGIKIVNGDLHMRSWVNDFLPYNTGGGFLADFKPSKTKLTEIPTEDISMIVIGTKEYIKRCATPAGKKFIKALYPYEHSSDKIKKQLLSSMDILYIETIEGDCCFMCVQGFDPEQVTKVITELYDTNPDIYIKVGSRAYRRPIEKVLTKRNGL